MKSWILFSCGSSLNPRIAPASSVLRRAGWARACGTLDLWCALAAVFLSAGFTRLQAADTYLLGLSNQDGVKVVDTAAGPDGSIYVLGSYTNVTGSALNDLRIGNTTLIRGWQGAEAGFLAKVGPDGAWRWALRMFGSFEGVGGKNSGVSAIAAGPQGVYVAGVARLALIVEDAAGRRTTVTANGTNDFGAPYGLKFDTEGRLQWGTMAKASFTSPCTSCPRLGGDPTANDIVVDSVGNVYVCGGIPNDAWVTFPGVSTSYGLPYNGGGFVAKLGPNGGWVWLAGYFGRSFRNQIYGMAIDERDRIYVTGEGSGRDTDALYNSAGSSVGTGTGSASSASVAILGRLTPAGNWDTSAGAANTGMRWMVDTAGASHARGRAVAVVNGKLYQTVEYEGDLHIHTIRKVLAGSGPGYDVGILRWTGNIGELDAATKIGGSPSESIGGGIGSDSADNIYVSGLFAEPQGNFGSNNFAQPPRGIQDGPDVTTSKTNIYVAKLNRDLEWQWVRRANGLPPDGFSGPPALALDKLTSRIYVAGGMQGGRLSLGSDTAENELIAAGPFKGWITVLESSGEFLEQVTLSIISEFGSSEAKPAIGSQVFLRGQSITASMPPVLYEDSVGARVDASNTDDIRDLAVVRHTCTGFEMLGTAVGGPGSTFGFTLDHDTELRFNWQTHYALSVSNNISGGFGGLGSTAAGNPEPVVQKHWIAENTISTAFIDGLLTSSNPNEFGTRYRGTGYYATGAAGPTGRAISFTSKAMDLGARPEYQPGSGPWTVEFWFRTGSVDQFSRRFINWAPLIHVSQEGGDGATNFVFTSDNSFAGPAVLSSVPVQAGEWHHFAFVNNAANWMVYYDGELALTQPTTGVLGNTTNPLLLGQFFDGALDELRIWKTARTQSEIRRYLLRSLPSVNDPKLLGYWSFDSGLSGKIADLKDPRITFNLGADHASVLGTIPDRNGGFIPWGGIQARQQVPQFIMNSPVTLEYRWAMEIRMQVGVATAALANTPVTVGGGITNTGSGEFWFTNGTPIRIIAPETATAPPETYQLKGYIGGLGNVGTVTGEGTRSNGFRFYDIGALTRGSAITWDYSDRIYKGRVVIGEAVNFGPGGSFAASEMIPASDQLNLSAEPVGTTIVSGTPAGSTIDDVRIWDDVADKLYPLRPGVILLEWSRQPGAVATRNIFTEITVTWPSPTNASFVHIADTPPVPLDQDKTNSVTFLSLKYSQSDKAQVNDASEFSVQDTAFTDPFWTVLVFSERTNNTPANGDLSREQLRIRTVWTKKWDNQLELANVPVGAPITSGFHSASVPHNGYVYFKNARYNPTVYNRERRTGPIIPVNRHPSAGLNESLVVVWYRTLEGIHWPYQSVKYTPFWASPTNRIVIASRLGSEGLDFTSTPQMPFAPGRYEQVSVYNQPDRNLPGYNPNEEHAFIAPSLLSSSDPTPAPVAYALRNNLNNTNNTDAYTSDPFVLVQYWDNQATNWGMAVYAIQTDDVSLPARRLEFTPGVATGTFMSLGTGGVLELNFPSVVGLRPFEAVQVEVNNNVVGLNSGRYFLIRSSDTKFMLSTTPGGAPLTVSAIVTNPENPKVLVTRAYPYVFEYEMIAGEPVLAPYPLQQIIGATPCAATVGENLDPTQFVYWEDHHKQPWAVSGSANPAAGLRAQFYYPLSRDFWHPTAIAGSCVAYVGTNLPVWVTNHVSWPATVPVLKAGETLTYAGSESKLDNPNAPGAPGVIGWAAGRVVYDDANAAMSSARTLTGYSVRLASPLTPLQVALPVASVPAPLQPAGGKVNVNGTEWTFKDLDASLQPRVFYDQLSQRLGVRGYVDGKTIGDSALTAAPGSISVLQPNILTVRDSNALVSLAPVASEWINAVSNLVRLSRDPAKVANGGYGVGLVPDGTNGAAKHGTQFGPGLALLPNSGLLDPAQNLRDGYITLAENDDASLGAAPVVLHIIRVQKQPLFRGAIKTINPPNPFDEKVALRHSGDFGANPADLIFEWYYKPDDGVTAAPPDLAPPGIWALFPDSSGNNGRGMSEISLAGAGPVTLSDNRFFVRWRHSNASAWSQWAGAANSRPPGTNELAQNTYVPQLAEGWVKRVIGAINPFDARISDFRNNDAPATYASMVQQAGAPYRGPVALNANQAVVENVGLIELYSTLIQRARSLSIDLSTPISTPAVNNSILLAASRIADLQLLLGNEAYTDAQDPTIGFGTQSSQYGSLAPTIFCFQNQVGTLLDEELTLLRGRSEEGAYPVYNRLLWNFTRAEGEAAYALSYNISDVNRDGLVNEADARILYPQGHGDAWGHYLSALRTYYDLLRHPSFNWQARSETLAIDGVVVSVDYLDERKFAQAAAAKAKAGAEVVNLTYRGRFVEDPDGQWQGYQDTDVARAWGVSDWARRAACASLFDWVTANAILPAESAKTGIEKVDRTTVKEIAQISAQAVEIRRQLDNANGGLNPIGLATDVVPFDIDPTEVGAGSGALHFEQVYDRAIKAMGNALDVFNHANQLNNMLRQVGNTVEQFAQDAKEQDFDFRNRLIEVFGTPYEGTIGPGRAYPPGYTGPDLYLYMYADVTGIQNVPAPSARFAAFFKPLPQGFVNAQAPGGGGNSIQAAWSHYFSGDAPNLEDNVRTDFTSTLQLDLPQTASGFAFQAPDGWGARRTPGEIQQAVSALVQAEADLQLALHDYDGLLGDIDDILILIRAQSGLQADNISYQEQGIASSKSIQNRIQKLRAASSITTVATDLADRAMDGVVEGFPKMVGLATDATAPIRSALKVGFASTVYAGLKTSAIATEQAAFGLEGDKELASLRTSLQISKADYEYAMQEQLKEFESLLGDEAAKRIEVFRKQEALRQASGKFRSILETGLRLMEERTIHNQQVAGATQKHRYQDFTFRVARNDALSKYRAAFELAARYAYLAAKAYDYESNLDPNDSASARPLLTQIVRARTLGAFENGVPRLGSGGLADALASLKVSFDVLKTQMGFNNPQTETGRFSLRNELFRIAPGPMLNGVRDVSTNRVTYGGVVMTAAEAWAASDAKWRDTLQNSSGANFSATVASDLWQVPEFRRYCRPFAPEGAGVQPGLIITFGSQITFAKNFFGWPLGGGDSSYDPSHFATKIRSVGLWLENYNGEGLSATPRAYLIPAGLDIMAVPTSLDLATREWNVVDQKIPVPLPVSQTGLRDPSYIPIRDSLNGTLAEIRRYSMFRAYHDGGFSVNQMTSDSRLIGRSVWNTRWMLIIPGGTLLSNAQEGLDTMLRGRVIPGSSPPSRDGNGVKDIKLFFQTYAYSGN